MAQGDGIKQPILGVVSTIVVILLAVGVMLWFDAQTFGTWTAFIAMASVPVGIIISLLWQSNYPPPAGKLDQPLKGFFLLFFSMVIALIVAAWSLKIVGGGLKPPTPFLLMYIITTVITTVWLVVVWQCWPISLFGKHPAWLGLGTLMFSYLVSWAIFRTFYDFSFMKGAPFYAAHLDPIGLFNAFEFLAWWVTFVTVLLLLVEFDFWPLSSIARSVPTLGKQPIFGLLGTVLSVIITHIIYYFFVTMMRMDPVVFMLRTQIVTIFGQFIMILMFQTAPFQTVAQPLKGFLLLIANVLLGQVLYYPYSWLCLWITGGLPSGPPGYVFELWMAPAFLGITFSLMVIYSQFFGFWPFSEPLPKQEE